MQELPSSASESDAFQDVNLLQMQRLSPQFSGFAASYQNAAETLLKVIEPELDAHAIFPVIFLYRQAIELTLKGMLLELDTSKLFSEKQVTDRGHSLGRQLPDIEKLAKTIGLEISTQTKDYIRELDEEDPQSQKFRYPKDRGGDQIPPDFDVTKFVEKSKFVLEELDEISDCLWQEMCRQEIQKELR